MITIPAGWARFPFSLGARAVVVTGVYVAAAAAVLLTVIGLRGLASPAMLRGLLGFIFIASLAAGLEPGTVKAAALGETGVDGAGVGAYLAASALKGLAAAPFLAILWRFADPAIGWGGLAWTPLVAVAGFCATDLRGLLDLRGRYALAIGVKQGSLAGGVALAGLLIALGAPLSWAIGVSTLARLGLLALWPGLAPGGRGAGGTWRLTRRLLADRRWMELAAVSVIAAAGGSADRVFGLRYLSPAAYGAYYVMYELFTRFWLIPYLLAPILFARQAAGDPQGRFVRAAWRLTAAAGAVFLAAVTCAVAFAPALLARLVGADFGYAALAFALAVVLGSLCQLRMAELQGAGRSRQAMAAAALGALVSAPLFYAATRAFGAPGLLVAWLVKPVVELAALSWKGGRSGLAEPGGSTSVGH